MDNQELILDFLVSLEAIQKAYVSKSGEFSNYEFKVTHEKNNVIINSYWETPEEGGSIDIELTIHNRGKYSDDWLVTGKKQEKGNTIYGEYHNERYLSYMSIEELNKHLIEGFLNIDPDKDSIQLIHEWISSCPKCYSKEIYNMSDSSECSECRYVDDSKIKVVNGKFIW